MSYGPVPVRRGRGDAFGRRPPAVGAAALRDEANRAASPPDYERSRSWLPKIPRQSHLSTFERVRLCPRPAFADLRTLCRSTTDCAAHA
eukprot:SAG22_NODE_9066_length_611_cov_1.787109_2_plen_89_part_00